MIRVLLGGVAGLATGYALKSYLEEECHVDFPFNLQTTENAANNATVQVQLGHLNAIKQKLKMTLFKETATLIELLNLPAPIEVEIDTNINIENTPENFEFLKEYSSRLSESEALQYLRLKDVGEIVLNATDFSKLSTEERFKIDYITAVDKFMRDACNAPLSVDNQNISLSAQKAFRNIMVSDKEVLYPIS